MVKSTPFRLALEMTGAQLKHRLRLYFENDTYYSNFDLTNSIQDGYDECVAFSGCILKATSLPFVANLSYYDMIALIPDYIGVYSIFNAVTKRWMIPISRIKLDGFRPDWETSIGTPEYFVPVSHRYLALFRKPSTTYGDFYVFYRAAAPTLTDTDSIQIPEDYTSALVDYNVSDLLEQQQEFSKASIHLQSYIENLEQLRVWVQNKRLPDFPPGLRP